MHHATIIAEFAPERAQPLTYHGQPIAGLRLHLMSERDAAYGLALELVEKIEPNPNDNSSWRVGGVWYHSLGAVVRAMLAQKSPT